MLAPERRAEIWNHVFRIASQPPVGGKWCTKDELVRIAAGSVVQFSHDELAEVMRGKKHKDALGVETAKSDGETYYR